jgi:hypothetical protein
MCWRGEHIGASRFCLLIADYQSENQQVLDAKSDGYGHFIVIYRVDVKRTLICAFVYGLFSDVVKTFHIASN